MIIISCNYIFVNIFPHIFISPIVNINDKTTNKKRIEFLKGLKYNKLSQYSVDDFKEIDTAIYRGGNLDSLKHVNKDLIEFAKNTDAANVSMESFYKSQIDLSNGIVGRFKAIKQYNDLVKHGAPEQVTAYTNALSDLDGKLGGTIKGLNGAKMGFGDCAKQLVGATAKTVAYTAANVALNAVLTFGVSMAISSIIAGITTFINKEKEAQADIEETIEKLKENVEEYKNEQEAIEELIDTYDKLALSGEDLTKSKEELTSIQDKLVEKLGDEAKAVDLVNGKYVENLNLIQKARYERAKEFINENQTGYDNAKDELKQESQFAGKDFTMSNGGTYLSFGTKGITEIKASGWGNWEKYKETIEKYQNIGYRQGIEGSKNYNYIGIFGTLEEQADTLDKLWKDLDGAIDKSNKNEMAWLTAIDKKRKELKEKISRDKELISSFEEMQKLIDGGESNEGEIPEDIQQILNNAYNYAQNIVGSSNSAEIYTWSETIKTLKDVALKSIDDNDTATKDTVESTFNDIESMIAEKTVGINSLLDGYNQNLKKFKDETYSKTNESLSRLDSARSALLQGESLSAADVKELIDIDASLADKFTKTADGYTIALSDIETARNNFFKSTKETIQKEIEANEKWAEDKEKQLDTIKESYTVTSPDNISSPSDAAEYADYTKKVKALNDDILKAKENTASWKTLLDILFNQPVNVDTRSPAEKVKEYFDTLKEYEKGGNAWLKNGGKVTTIVSNSGNGAANFSSRTYDKDGTPRFLSDEEVRDYAQKVLSGGEDYLKLRVGFEFTGEGAEEAAKNAASKINELTKKFWEAASGSFDYSSYSDEADAIKSDVESIQQIIDSIDEGTYNDEAWGLVTAHPELISVIDDTDKLRGKLVELRDNAPDNLVETLRSIRTTLTDKSQIKAIDNLIARLQELPESITGYNDVIIKLKNQIKLYDDKIKAIEEEKDKQNEILESLNEQKEALETIISNYESAASAVSNAIDREIKSLEDEKKLIEDRYNTEIDALKSENEERDRANELREKELALAKARNTQVRVYDKERGGFRIESDKSVLEQAQREYDDALNNNRIAELESQRDAETALIDEKIEAYEKYKEAWQEAIDSYKNAQDEINAAAILGYGWRDAVMAKDTGLINSFALNYAGFQNQLHYIIEPQIEDAQSVIKEYDKQIDQYEKLKKEQEGYLDFYEEYSVRFANATEKQTLALKAFTSALREGGESGVIGSLFEGVLKAFRGFSKGGIVDFTGPAMLHGTPSNPEMVLNNKQISTLWKLLSTGQTEQMNRFMNSAPSVFSGSMNYPSAFNGTPNYMNNKTIDRITERTTGSIDNSTTIVFTGNDIRAKNYDEFRGYMDRYIREANMNRLVGKK